MKRKTIFTVIIAVMISMNLIYANEDIKLREFKDNNIADIINKSELTSNATAAIEDETLKVTLKKGADDPHFMLPVEDLNAQSEKDNILAICLKTTYRTFEYDYAYLDFVTTEGQGTVTANSYAVTEKWQVIYFRLGSNENYKGTLKSLRLDPFAKAPDNDNDALYQIKWFAFFEDINEAKDYSDKYLNKVNPSPVPGETEAPHVTEKPVIKPKKDKSIWKFVWTIILMLVATVIITYFLERQRNIQMEKSKNNKGKKKKR